MIGESQPPKLRTVDVPSKWLATIKQASVLAGNDNQGGGFQVITKFGYLVCEPAGHPMLGFIAGIPFVSLVTNKKSSPYVVVFYYYAKIETLDEGILISGKCSPNYFHWIIEYLTRGYVLSKINQLQKIPLIIDAKMYQQEIDTLKMVFPDNPIYYLNRDVLLQVDKLYVPSIPTYHPDNLSVPSWQGSALCYRTLDYLNHHIKNACDLKLQSTKRNVFITRRSGRNIINSGEIEALMQELNFEIVDTATLTFVEQLELFANANILVGAMGAAFTNLIFCQKGTKVLALCSPYAKRFCMQANLAKYSGCDYQLLAGETPGYTPGKENNFHNTIDDLNLLHSNFSINPELIRKVITEWS